MLYYDIMSNIKKYRDIILYFILDIKSFYISINIFYFQDYIVILQHKLSVIPGNH